VVEDRLAGLRHGAGVELVAAHASCGFLDVVVREVQSAQCRDQEAAVSGPGVQEPAALCGPVELVEQRLDLWRGGVDTRRTVNRGDVELPLVDYLQHELLGGPICLHGVALLAVFE
jgi:hypothetical protein